MKKYFGLVAQLAVQFLCKEKVSGSTPLRSTNLSSKQGKPPQLGLTVTELHLFIGKVFRGILLRLDGNQRLY